jgi:RimJ/RimL family protein N-acetyltransferase
VFAVVEAGEAVGVCSLLGVGGDPRSAELGYWIGRPHWGRGFATDAGRRVVGFGFRDLSLERIRSSCLLRNPASRRVLEKLGFRQTGVGGNADPKWNAGERFALFELDRSDWRPAAPLEE